MLNYSSLARSARLKACALLSIPLLIPTIADAIDPPTRTAGFDSVGSYSSNDVDHISLFNGNLTIALPIGQRYPINDSFSYGLTLVYNNNSWEQAEGVNPITQDPYSISDPKESTNVALGWNLSLGGSLIEEGTPVAGVSDWFFVGADGNRHQFYETLHIGDPGSAPNFILYTRDGSYLRLHALTRVVDQPDGSTLRFDAQGRLVAMRSAHDQLRNVDSVTVSYGANGDWTIQDRHGRSHSVSFAPTPSGTHDHFPQVVSRVDLAAFAGSTATYLFGQGDGFIPRPCGGSGFSGLEGEVRVPLLTSITLPEGDQHSIGVTDYRGFVDVAAWNPNGFYSCVDSGQLLGFGLTTSGRLEWDYATYRFPVGPAGHCKDGGFFANSQGVAERRLVDSGGTTQASWTYSQELDVPWGNFCGPNGQQPYESKTTVTNAIGQKTEHFFAVPHKNELGWQIAEYGLPYTRRDPSNGHFLSTKVYDSGDVLMRSTYLRYEWDEEPGSIGFLIDGQAPELNQRRASTRVVHHDDSDHSTESVNSDFDGLGHYRTSARSGSWGTSVRSGYTRHNPSRGTYGHLGIGNFSPFPEHLPWVLGTFDQGTVSEGGSTQLTEFCFDPSNGDLLRVRVRKGSNQSNKDVIQRLTYDILGHVSNKASFGGDIHPLAVTAGSLCTLPLTGSNDYEVTRTFENGVLKTAKYAGLGYDHFLTDRVIDPNSGMIAGEWGPTKLYQSYDYDRQGRMILRKPAVGEGACTSWSFGFDSVRVRERSRSGSSCSSTNLTSSWHIVDDFGRLYRERISLPGQAESMRETLYDSAGRTASVSEFAEVANASGSPVAPVFHRNRYLDYDGLGRVKTVIPADGASHEVRHRYAGVRWSRVRTMVGTTLDTSGLVVEQFNDHIEIRDPFGRLTRVREQSRPSDNYANTDYRYDVGSRLIEVKTPGYDGLSSQIRTFAYDGRGFLTSRCAPEQGFDGRGCVQYRDYDARGHATRIVDDHHDLTYSFSRAGQMETIQRTGGLMLKEFFYGTSVAARNIGMIERSIRHNHVIAPDTGQPFDVRIEQQYDYLAVGGRVSKRATLIHIGAAPTTFETSWSYNDIGQVTRIDYPRCASVDCANPTISNTAINNQFDKGFLASVGGVASSISYHPNGMVDRIDHANGVSEIREKDPNDIRRVRRIYTTGASSNWDSGLYQYDGSGNPVKIGNETYLFDLAQRVKEGHVSDPITGVSHSQRYGFDHLGNLKQIDDKVGAGPWVSRTISITAGTNRLSGGQVAYDASGDLTNWGGSAYAYDEFGMMTRNQGHGNDIYYLYDANGERTWTVDWKSAGGWGSSLQFFSIRDLDGSLLRNYQLLGDNTTPQQWTLAQEYFWGNGRLLRSNGVGGSAVKHFHIDHLRSPRLVTTTPDFGGTHVKEKNAYLPFGESTATQNPTATKMRFTGQEHDRNAQAGSIDDLYNMHARYYTPQLSRFMSPDPLDGVLGRPQSWNRYAYVSGRPVSFTDPSGLRQRETFHGSTTVCEVAATGAPCDPPTDSEPVNDTGVQGLTDLQRGADFWAEINSNAPPGYGYGGASLKAEIAKANAAGLGPCDPTNDSTCFILGSFHDDIPILEALELGVYAFTGGVILAELGIAYAATRTAQMSLTEGASNGWRLSFHSVSKGITKDQIRATLAGGARYFDPEHGTIVFALARATGKYIHVAVSPANATITTVYRSRSAFLPRFIPLPF